MNTTALPGLKIKRLQTQDCEQLKQLFTIIEQDPAAANFHPHSFNANMAAEISVYAGRDLYLGARLDKSCDALVGYGMLRGWDEGYVIPMLGIYLAPHVRGCGLSQSFLVSLHKFARIHGARTVRLKVYPKNIAALNSYYKIGYNVVKVIDAQLLLAIDLDVAIPA